MGNHAALLRNNLDLVIEREAHMTARFYEHLFSRYPQVRALFGRHTAEKQQEMLQRAIVAVVDHLDDGVWLDDALAALGAKHVDYGVTPEMYAWVGECLLMTLAEISGADWNTQLEAAWRDAYTAICQRMIPMHVRATPVATQH